MYLFNKCDSGLFPRLGIHEENWTTISHNVSTLEDYEISVLRYQSTICSHRLTDAGLVPIEIDGFVSSVDNHENHRKNNENVYLF